MDDYALALQPALIAALAADFTLSDLVGGRIYDDPPQGAALPLIRLGDIVPAPDDTDGAQGAAVQVGIEVHSRPVAGRVEAARILGAVALAFHRRPDVLSVAGFTVSDVEVQTWTTTRGDDGQGYTGTLAMRVDLDR